MSRRRQRFGRVEVQTIARPEVRRGTFARIRERMWLTALEGPLGSNGCGGRATERAAGDRATERAAEPPSARQAAETAAGIAAFGRKSK